MAIRRTYLASQFGIGEAFAKNMRQHTVKSLRVSDRATVVFAYVVAECLLVKIAEEMEWFYADVSSLQSTLQKAPEVFEIVGVNLPVYVSDGVVYHLMFIISNESLVRWQRISEESGFGSHMFSHFRLERFFLAARNDVSMYISAALKNSQNGSLALVAVFYHSPLAYIAVHIAGLSTDECFVHFDFFAFATEFYGRISLHGESDAVQHEPCGLLGDADSAGHFIGTDAIFAIGDHPNGNEPLVETDWRILENGSDFDAELPMVVNALALPLPLIRKEVGVFAFTSGANNAVWPAQVYHPIQTVIWTGEVNDCLLECFWLFHVYHLNQGYPFRSDLSSILLPEMGSMPCFVGVAGISNR